MSYGLAEEPCPVADQTLGELYRSHQHGLAALVETVSPNVRAMLALYCYRRAHLQTLGLSVAASCTEDDLVEAGGQAGAVLFALARKAPEPLATPSGRRKVSLSSGPLSAVAPIDDEIDDEIDGEVAASGA